MSTQSWKGHPSVHGTFLGPKPAAVIGSQTNKGQGMFPWLPQTFFGEDDLRDEPKNCLRRRLARFSYVDPDKSSHSESQLNRS